MLLLGFDIGSSSVKGSLVDGESGKCLASAFYPKQEMKMVAHQAGWAEQDPELWWENLKLALKDILNESGVLPADIGAIGISYQMHGLVLAGKDFNVLRPSIIWCDSRATGIGENAFREIGNQKCLTNLLNSPGNFTASKLSWVKENEHELFDKIHKAMLPGDFIAMKMTGEIKTTISGLSEGIMWNFKENSIATLLLDHYGIDGDLIPELTDTFGVQGQLSEKAANELGLKPGIKISYRAGDQPNNALSLNVLNPGEIAATAGTSGVVYGVSDKIKFDPLSRVNTFAHVNHSDVSPRLGVLLCINGTGILNSWLKANVGNNSFSYEEMNEQASKIPIGSENLAILPFGNGAERVLKNTSPGAQISGLNFNIHHSAHLFRAAQEGIAFSFKYGMDVMENIGVKAQVIRAGHANMFLSPIFRETLACITDATIELFNTDGSIGAARGAGIGCGYYKSESEAFSNLQKLEVVQPDIAYATAYQAAYLNWKEILEKSI